MLFFAYWIWIFVYFYLWKSGLVIFYQIYTMFFLLKLIRLKKIQFRIIRSLPASVNRGSNLNLICYERQVTPFYRKYSSPTLWYCSKVTPNIEVIDIDKTLFETVSEETLDSLTEFFENLVDERKELESADVSYSSGVLTVNLGRYGTYVINRQSPNKQIWLSSPTSGPKRYDYIVKGSYWIYRHDNTSIHQLLENELSNILGENIDLSKCSHSKV